MQLSKFLNQAIHSDFKRRLLNIFLWRMIPFNSPHKFRIIAVTENSIRLNVPYIRRNKNHINGIHACALATACEYISGLSLTRTFDPAHYRIILKEIQMTYHYQAKEEVRADFSLPDDEANAITKILQTEDAAFRWYNIEMYNLSEKHICTGRIYWQIKPWSKAKTTA